MKKNVMVMYLHKDMFGYKKWVSSIEGRGAVRIGENQNESVISFPWFSLTPYSSNPRQFVLYEMTEPIYAPVTQRIEYEPSKLRVARSNRAGGANFGRVSRKVLQQFAKLSTGKTGEGSNPSPSSKKNCL